MIDGAMFDIYVSILGTSRRSLDFQSFWYLSLGMPIFAIIRVIKTILVLH